MKYLLSMIATASLLFGNSLLPTIDYENFDKNRDIKEIEKIAINNPYLSDINFMLGVYYMAGDVKKNTPPDFKKALYYLQKDSKNLAMANYKIAELYYYGYGVEINYDLAIEYFKKTLNKELKDYKGVAPVSLLAISQIYLEKKVDYENALPFLLQASQEFDKVESQMILAFMYYEGKGVSKNETEANYWLNKAYFNKNANGEHKAYLSNYIEPVNTFNIESDVRNYCGVLK